jgi:hypothetical protein
VKPGTSAAPDKTKAGDNRRSSKYDWKRNRFDRIKREMDKQNPEFYMELYCVIHLQSICGKTLTREDALKDGSSVENFIRSHDLIIASFNAFVGNR